MGDQIKQRILRYLLDREHAPDPRIPRLGEIAHDLGISKKEISDQLDILDAQGAIKANRTLDGDAIPLLIGTGKAMLQELEEKETSHEMQPAPKEAASGLSTEKQYEWDVFISHASEDKDSFVRPLAQELSRSGVRVWYDEFTLSVGDSLRRSIDEGISRSRYGIVILSHSFFNKDWPQRELDGLVALEHNGQKVILPIWLDVEKAHVAHYSPTLADLVAAKANEGLPKVIVQILRVIKPDFQTDKSAVICYITKDKAKEMGRTLSRLVGLEYRADNAPDLEAILGRAVRMVVQDYDLIPQFALILGMFTVEVDPSQREFILKGNSDVCLFAEQLISGQPPHIPELDA